MDAKSVGLTIAELRKKHGMTQMELAKRLNISDKAVSKWESGLGYPEITQFPALSQLFGVTVDFLMTGEQKGIIIAGNILVDLVKNIDYYPKKGMLSNISRVSRAVGGCVPNTAINLSKIDRSIPIGAIGRVGDDEYGRYVVSKLQQHRIDTGGVKISGKTPTSFSDVMSLPSGERTFFHARGVNAEFSPEDINLNSLNCNILHIGYILLLDRFDREDAEYGTVMARFLNSVQQRGIKTCIDAVSDSTADYKAKMLPCLKYCDYCVINEIECCNIFGLSSENADGEPNIENIKKAMTLMMAAGVREKVIIHSKKTAFCLNSSGEFITVPSLKIPTREIKGSVGAGDAFCAGCLYAIYNNFDDQAILKFASAAAACNLFSENSVDGMKPKEEILELEKKYGRIKL